MVAKKNNIFTNKYKDLQINKILQINTKTYK
jgi:hypothetical protein